MRLLSINTGRAAPLFATAGQTATPAASAVRPVQSGIRKQPVSSLADPQPVALGPLGVQGDEQADRRVHGGRSKAVYAYPAEHYAVWRTMRQQATGNTAELPYGAFGENLTLAGLTEDAVWVGDLLVFEDSPVRLRVTSPRSPCFKFNAVMGFRQASSLMNQSGYTGFYLEVVQGGPLAAGAALRVEPGERTLQMRILDLHRMQVRGGQEDLF